MARQHVLLCSLAYFLTSAQGMHSDDSQLLQVSIDDPLKNPLSMLDVATIQEAMSKNGVCFLRGDVHVVPFAGSKFSETTEGVHQAFVVDNLQGANPFEVGDLSLFTFNAGDTVWSVTGTPDPSNKLSFTVNGNILKIENNGNTNLPNGLLFQIKAFPRASHINMVVEIVYGQGCPPLKITPLIFSGLCGGCNTAELEIGHPAISRPSVDGWANYYTIDVSNMCFATDGLLTSVHYYARFPRPFRLVIFEHVSGAAYRIVSYPVNETAVAGLSAYHLSPAVPVKAGQCIGWYVSATGAVFDMTYVSGTSDTIRFSPFDSGFRNVGQTVAFPGISNRKYSILSSYVASP